MSDELLIRILTDPEVTADPYPLLHELRETSPVHKAGFADLWALTRFEDCRAALRDSRLSYPELGGAESAPMPGGLWDPDRPRSALSLNPPDHTRVRSLAGRAFTSRRVERLRASVRAMADDLLDPVAEAGECDLVEALASPLPANVVSELIGIPVADRDRLRSLMSDVSDLLELTLRPWERAQALASEAKVYEYLNYLIDCKRAEPGDDLLSGLVAASDHEDRLSQKEIVGTVSHIYGAGFRTTMSLIGNMVLTLMRHPDQLARLRADRSLVPSTVDEVLRFESPVQTDGRFVGADVEIGGQTIPKGHRVLLLFAAANRDPSVVDDPDRFDVGRDEIPTLAFGAGIHYCLGAALARLEGQVVLEALLDRFDTWMPLDLNPPWRQHKIILRGLASLPVRMES